MAEVMGRCGRGHEAPLGRLCMKCAVIRYREADEAEAKVARMTAAGEAIYQRLQVALCACPYSDPYEPAGEHQKRCLAVYDAAMESWREARDE